MSILEENVKRTQSLATSAFTLLAVVGKDPSLKSLIHHNPRSAAESVMAK